MQRKLWEDTQISGISFYDLFEAYMECRSNKRNTTNAIQFEIDYEANLMRLLNEINTGQYYPGRSIAFVIDKPDKREIFAADLPRWIKLI